MWRVVLTSVVLMLLAVAYLFHAQREYQTCVANYLAQDSAARTVRSDASAKTINSLVKESHDLFQALDPAHQPPSKKTIAQALESIQVVPADAAKFNESINKYPYPKYTCGGTTPGDHGKPTPKATKTP